MHFLIGQNTQKTLGEKIIDYSKNISFDFGHQRALPLNKTLCLHFFVHRNFCVVMSFSAWGEREKKRTTIVCYFCSKSSTIFYGKHNN